MKEGNNLDNLRKEYQKLKTKYSLPEFKEINEDFDIEKIDGKETEFLSREIRRVMLERSIAYVRFIENFLNPANAPMFFLALIKNIPVEEKKKMEKIYLRLGKLYLESVMLDNIYNEKKDAEFIKKLSKEWKTVKQEVDVFMQKLLSEMENTNENKKNGYLG